MKWRIKQTDGGRKESSRTECQWTTYQIRKIADGACVGNAGNVFPAAEFKGNRELAIPACITARMSRTCRDACRNCLPTVAGKTLPAFPAHAHPQFYVFGKRPISCVKPPQNITQMLFQTHIKHLSSHSYKAWWFKSSLSEWAFRNQNSNQIYEIVRTIFHSMALIQ